MPKEPFDDYRKEIAFQRDAWQRKAVLRLLYQHWYQQIVAALAPNRPVIEIGAGSGNFKEFFPECIATDVFQSGPWIDRVLDAENLNLAPGEAGNLVVFDVLHHLQRPVEFLRRAAAALQPNGRLILCEPAATPWARLVYGRSHHEPLDLKWDPLSLDGTPAQDDPGHTFANLASAEILFWRNRERTLQLLPQLRLTYARKFGFLLYPMTGGFSYRCFVPEAGFQTLLKVEDLLVSPFANWLTGMRMLIVLTRVAE
ncbi:MAG TPA: methyltransferase domain-containing protein [Planctomycetota bacterium]|jgi:SAM-dependent methyltransferase